MQFKSFFLIVSAVSAVLAGSTVGELTTDVSNIDSKLAVLENYIRTFPQAGGTYQQAFELHNSVDVVVDAIQAAIATAEGINGPVSLNDGQEILNSFQGMLPLINSSLYALEEKKEALLSLGFGRANSIIGLDLQVLRKAVIDLEIGFIAIAPPECVAEAKHIATGVKASLDASISLVISL